MTVCTNPESASTPMCAFMPKCHPVQFQHEPRTAQRPAPLLGEHTWEILGQLGYEKQAISDLLRQGVVRASESKESPV